MRIALDTYCFLFKNRIQVVLDHLLAPLKLPAITITSTTSIASSITTTTTSTTPSTATTTMTMPPFPELARRHTTRFFIDDILVSKPKPLPREPAAPIISRPPFLDYAPFAAASLSSGPCPLLLTPPFFSQGHASFLNGLQDHPAFLLNSARGKEN